MPITKIGERAEHRKKPLEENTLARIRRGLKEYAHQALLCGNYSPGWARPMSDATGVVTTQDHHSVVMPPFIVETAYSHAKNKRSRDLLFQPDEIARAMAFPDEYVVLGNKREKTKQYGAAVTPPVMRKLIDACLETYE